MKRFLFLVLMLSLLLMPGSASAEEHLARIARIPIILQTSQIPDRETMASLETKLDRALHIPLNNTLQVAEYLPEAECVAALDSVLAEMEKTGRKVKLKDAMKPLADKLQADIVVCPVLLRYGQYRYISINWDHGTIICSTASVELTGYERATDQVFHKKFGKSFRDEYSPWGTADALANECMDHVIDETGIHGMITKLYSSKDEKNVQR